MPDHRLTKVIFYFTNKHTWTSEFVKIVGRGNLYSISIEVNDLAEFVILKQ